MTVDDRELSESDKILLKIAVLIGVGPQEFGDWAAGILFASSCAIQDPETWKHFSQLLVNDFTVKVSDPTRLFSPAITLLRERLAGLKEVRDEMA